MKRTNSKRKNNSLSVRRAYFTGDVKTTQSQSKSTASLSSLTCRRIQILEGLLRGMRAKEIAELLGSSAATVQGQIASIHRVMGVRSTLELIAKVYGIQLCKLPGDPEDEETKQ